MTMKLKTKCVRIKKVNLTLVSYQTPLEVRGKGKQTEEITKRPKTAKEKSGEKSKTKSAFLTPLNHANSISKTCQINN